MKLLSDITNEIYHKETGTNNLNGSIENDFSKELSRVNWIILLIITILMLL